MTNFNYQVGWYSCKNKKAELIASFKNEKDAKFFIDCKLDSPIYSFLIYFIKVDDEIIKLKTVCMSDYVSNLFDCIIFERSIDEENDIELDKFFYNNQTILSLLSLGENPENPELSKG